jgi:hypothetical protein
LNPIFFFPFLEIIGVVHFVCKYQQHKYKPYKREECVHTHLSPGTPTYMY